MICFHQSRPAMKSPGYKNAPRKRGFYHQAMVVFCLSCLFFITTQPVFAQDQTPQGGPTYVVQAGDTLYLIALKFGTSVDDLLKVNTLVNPDFLSPGDELVIPGLEGVQGKLTTENLALGETLRSLSVRHQITIEQITKLNHLTSPSEAFAGANLILPDPGENAQPEGRYMMGAGQSLLELAVAENQNPWLLAELNQLQGSWEALPNEAIFAPPSGEESNGQEEAGVSLISPLIQKLEIDPLPLTQGFATVIKVTAPQLSEISGTLAGSELHFFPNGENQWAALQGIHAMADPGLVPIVLQGTAKDGQRFSFEQMVVLQLAGYASENINGVDPQTIDPAVTAPEMEQVLAITKVINPTKYWDGAFTVPGYDPNWITSWFGTRRAYNGEETYSAFHTGVDYGGGTGLEIKSPAAGVVVFAGELTVRGNATIIDHGWGVYSGFWHQSEFKVKVGDTVEPGQVIGLVGGTGRVTGPHLHWEVWVNGVQVEPLTWLENNYP